jgi:hypothetical protein
MSKFASMWTRRMSWYQDNDMIYIRLDARTVFNWSYPQVREAFSTITVAHYQ